MAELFLLDEAQPLLGQDIGFFAPRKGIAKVQKLSNGSLQSEERGIVLIDGSMFGVPPF
jgi:hypothetical protein